MKKHILLSLLLCMTCIITNTMEENTEIKTLIQKRTFYNALLAATNIAMMGIDIANCYFPEEGPFSQKGLQNTGWFSLSEDPNIHQPCECPSGERSCTIQMPPWNTYKCQQTIFDAMGEGAIRMTNYGTTITRFGLCCSNLYNLYHVQKTLYAQSITEEQETHNQQTIIDIQGTSGAITSLLTTIAGFYMNGITHYPRTFIVCGANAAIDLFGFLNSHENEKACREVMLITHKKTS